MRYVRDDKKFKIQLNKKYIVDRIFVNIRKCKKASQW